MQTPDASSRFGALLAFGALALGMWAVTYRRWRVLSDHPTARLSSAPQGYVELAGRGGAHPDYPLHTRFGQLPCVWNRWRVERKRDNQWRVVDEGQTDAPFLLRDGEPGNEQFCEVDPAGADVIPAHKQVLHQGDERITEWVIYPVEMIYVLGELSTFHPLHDGPDVASELDERVSDLKADQTGLLARFDLDGNGEIDSHEWRLARSQMQREVDSARRNRAEQAVSHVVRRSSGGRPFLISNLPPRRLARRYLWWAWGEFSALALTLFLLSR